MEEKLQIVILIFLKMFLHRFYKFRFDFIRIIYIVLIDYALLWGHMKNL